ncbi:hypothetical protein AVEN_126073-1 [Araneus ventricosus]|uniref:Mos1 transposase HTH domain-containing protein n=1 Tax=Araneus ventricosus TaxID=182803 RepID=A0A4Y2CL80_ARAVE|nr:hypothetical protein AVEN_126073-1 [Araneus ventricosus]
MLLTITSSTAYVSSQFSAELTALNMATRIGAPAKCELQSVIRFLQAEWNSAAEIRRRNSRVYVENFMRDDVVRDWCRKFKDGCDKEEQRRKSAATEDLVQLVPGSFRSSLNGASLITRRTAPTER